MSFKERRKLSQDEVLNTQGHLQNLSFDDQQYDTTTRSSHDQQYDSTTGPTDNQPYDTIIRPTAPKTSLFGSQEVDTRLLKLQELQGFEKYGLELPQVKTKRTPYISHFDSYQVHSLLNPTRGIRDEMRRKGITPRDHHKANIAAIAMSSAKVHNMRNGNIGINLPNGRTSRLRTSMSSTSGIRELHSCGERCDTPDNVSVVTESSQLSKNKKVNYMARNMNSIALATAIGKKKMISKEVDTKTPNENYGTVPAYLLRRKLELEQDRERRIQEEKEKHLPPGLVLMKNEERLEVLKTLEDNKDKLVNKLSSMPLVVETPSQIRGKAEIDTQLKEVDDSIKRFSRPRVYIRYSH